VRIAFLLTGYFPDVFGGAEVYTRNLANALRAGGHAPSIVTLGLGDRSARRSDEWREGILVHRFAFDRPYQPPHVYAVRFWPRLYDEALRYFRANRPDVVHVTNAWFMSAAILAAMHAGIPVVGTHVDFLWTCKDSHLLLPGKEPCTGSSDDCRNCFPDIPDKDWPWARDNRARLMRLLARGYSRHHCPCELMARHIRAAGAPADSISVFPYGVPDKLACAAEPKAPSSQLRLGFVGRWNRIKGLDVLLAAMKSLANRPNVHLCLYGEQESWSQDSYGQEIAALATRLPNVTVRGRFNPASIADIHKGMDCLVTPSIWPENSPVSILEALALGTPVICADGEGMTNIVRDGHNGLVFRSRDSTHLADRIRSIADAPDLLHRLQANARCLRTIADDVREFELIYSAAKPCTVPEWIQDSEDFVATMREEESRLAVSSDDRSRLGSRTVLN
jgi:glycosyltransferase involved in cell wall biosynthesis